MAIYKNISSPTTTTLITKGGNRAGGIKKITIANKATATSNEILLHLDDGTNVYTILRTDMPPKTTLVLDDNLNFDSSKYDLKITTSSVADITVIIK
tara:strand:+ start:7623 stop:7913 length:291 start_codon:yes stop_codon:yes gene_type:complete